MNSEIFGDLKNWCAISCPVEGLRFDRRTLELMDSDGDGHIRTPEVAAAVEYMKSKGVSLEDLAVDDPECAAKLEAVTARQKDLAGIAPTADEASRFAEWAQKGASADIAVLGDRTKDAEAALAAVALRVIEHRGVGYRIVAVFVHFLLSFRKARIFSPPLFSFSQTSAIIVDSIMINKMRRKVK